MSGFEVVEYKPKHQARNPNSRRQQKFQSQRSRGEMSAIPNEESGVGMYQHVPVEHEVNGHTMQQTLLYSIPQPVAYYDSSTSEQRGNAKSQKGHSKTFSLGSGFTAGTGQTGHTNNNFYAPKKTSVLNPKAHSWKSPVVKLEEDFARMHKVVSFIAPEQFKNPAKPIDGPCGVVPATLPQFIEHRQAMAEMSSRQMQKNISSMKDQIAARKAHGAIKSSLGKGAKIHDSGFSPVVCMPTIWANEFAHFNIPQAKWPSQTELQFNGDNRENLATRCGRYLPPPRFPTHEDIKFYDVPILPALSFDQTGPIFDNGPEPVEVMRANIVTDNDPVFEYAGRALLGGELLEEMNG